MELTHLNERGLPKMVDVSEKSGSTRVATASGTIKMSSEAYKTIKKGSGKKGPVLQTAVIAAVMGAKKTSELIPMCHPLMLSSVNCEVEEVDSLPGFKLTVTVKVEGKTGVEMEALTAVSVGLLTVYDMAKAIDKGMEISDIKLLRKSGGRSGEYLRG